ncbi:uncharacterized protein BCR38DRAFT_350570 [Pseudomassariella vexata]|uniref:DUF1746 domain-containing protein n=1 Tax=Pseudomassariella vexata TaxID=1141098 RepID=A0A1Y2DLN6_9PEZI|nr:uncharacterized protein BCR38DRAFT_350570 [Pseudomassariella vexata]ORY60172.1 hypothetical protein BCR38DRAFT_350570 [Pseudomassariella vexata]
MNHDATAPTEPADPHPNETSHRRTRRREDRVQDADLSTDQQQQQNGSTTANTSQQPQPHRTSLSKKAKEGLSKKLVFLIHLLRSLDTLICAELCALYYMDCSFFRLMIRWAPQWLYLSPKSENLILIIPNYPVGAILGPNAFCMLFHIITTLPHAGEAARGYLHGGVLIDFVGQKPPSSKFTLLFLDLVVLSLQCFMLAVNMEKDRIKTIVKPPKRPAAVEGGTQTMEASTSTTGQDHDAEERGVHRDAPTVDETNDVELRPMGSDREGGDEDLTTLLDRSSGHTTSYEELGNILSSGNAVLSDFHVRHSLRTAWNDSGNTTEGAAAYALQNVGYNATLAALAAQRRARLTAAQGTAQPRQS